MYLMLIFDLFIGFSQFITVNMCLLVKNVQEFK